ncbi:MAG: hypothetical protein J2P37_27500, partial [Ktedonobacteraceae bacterium]|nr:hypothetical protein [Ktedonobacteraceae bacterium]
MEAASPGKAGSDGLERASEKNPQQSDRPLYALDPPDTTASSKAADSNRGKADNFDLFTRKPEIDLRFSLLDYHSRSVLRFMDTAMDYRRDLDVQQGEASVIKQLAAVKFYTEHDPIDLQREPLLSEQQLRSNGLPLPPKNANIAALARQAPSGLHTELGTGLLSGPDFESTRDFLHRVEHDIIGPYEKVNEHAHHDERAHHLSDELYRASLDTVKHNIVVGRYTLWDPVKPWSSPPDNPGPRPIGQHLQAGLDLVGYVGRIKDYIEVVDHTIAYLEKYATVVLESSQAELAELEQKYNPGRTSRLEGKLETRSGEEGNFVSSLRQNWLESGLALQNQRGEAVFEAQMKVEKARELNTWLLTVSIPTLQNEMADLRQQLSEHEEQLY